MRHLPGRAGVLLFVCIGAASSAHATLSSALNTGNPTCSYNNFQFNNTCTNLVVANLPEVGGLQGITFSLNGASTGFDQSTAGALTIYDSSTIGTTTAVMKFTASGVPDDTNGGGLISAGASILLAGDFNLGLDTTSLGGAGSIVGTYTLSFDLTTGGNSIFGGPVVLNGINGATNQISQAALTTAAYNPANSYLLTEILTVNWSRTTGTPGLIVSIPAGSLDFNALQSSSPEPDALGLCSAGLVALAWLARRRAS